MPQEVDYTKLPDIGGQTVDYASLPDICQPKSSVTKKDEEQAQAVVNPQVNTDPKADQMPLVNQDDEAAYRKLSFLDNGLSNPSNEMMPTDVIGSSFGRDQKKIADERLAIYNKIQDEYNQNVKKASAELGIPEQAVKTLDLVQKSMPYQAKTKDLGKQALSSFYKGLGSAYKAIDGIGAMIGESLGIKPRGKDFYSYLGKLGNDAYAQAKQIDETNVQDNTIAGEVISGASQMAPDLIMSWATPEAKLSGTLTKGFNVVLPKFANWLAIKELGTDKVVNPDGSVTDRLKAAGKGFSEGYIMHGIGLAGDGIAKTVGALGGNMAAQQAAATTGEGLMFWGDAILQDPESWKDKDGNFGFNWDKAKEHAGSSFGMALAFKLKDAPEAMQRTFVANSIAKKAYLDYYTATPQEVTDAVNIKKTPKELRIESNKLWSKAKEAKTDVERSQAIAAKEAVDRVSRLKLASDMIAKDPDGFKKAIDSDTRLSPEQRKEFKDRIDNTVQENDNNTIPKYKIGDKDYDTKDEFIADVEKLKGQENTPEIVVSNDNETVSEVQSILKPEKPKEVVAPTPEEMTARAEQIKQENATLDTKISEAQQRLNLPKSPDIQVSDNTEVTLDRIDKGEPVTNEFVKSASDELYKHYNDLEQMKKSDTRRYTTEQINSMQGFIGDEITKLEDYATKQKETGQFVSEATTGKAAEAGAGKPLEVGQINDQVKSVADKIVKGEKLTSEDNKVQGEFPNELVAELQTRKVAEQTTKTTPDVNALSQELQIRKEEARQKIADGFDQLATLIGAKKQVMGDKRPDLVDAVSKIASGLTDYAAAEGIALKEAVKRVLSKYNYNVDDSIIDDAISQITQPATRKKGESSASKTQEMRAGRQAQEQGKTQEQAVQPVGGVPSEYGTEAPSPQKEKVSRFGERIKSKDSKVIQQVKDTYDGTYKPVTDKEIESSAQQLVDNLDYEDIHRFLSEGKGTEHLKGVTGILFLEKTTALSDKAMKSGNVEEADRLAFQQGVVGKIVDDIWKDAGRVVRSAGTIRVESVLAPRTHVRQYTDGVDKARERAKEPESYASKRKNRLENEAKEETKKAAKKTIKTDKVDKAKKKAAEKQATDKAKATAAEKLASRIAASMKTKDNKTTPEGRMINTLLAKFKERDIKIKKEKDVSDVEKLAEAISLREEYSNVWKEARDETIKKIKSNTKLSGEEKQSFIDRVNTSYDKATKTPISDALINRALKEEMRKINMSIDDVVKKHYDIQGRNKKQLIDALIKDVNLSEADAKELANVVSKEFDRLIGERAQKLVNKYINKVKNPKTAADKEAARTQKSEADKLIELISAGAFQNPEFVDAFITVHGIPEINAEHVKEIERRARLIHNHKREQIRMEETIGLMNYVANIKGISWKELADSIWYANVLSGISTQSRNFLFAGMDVGWTLVTRAGLDPIKWNYMLDALFTRGMPWGTKVASDVLKTGHVPFETRVEATSIAERATEMEGKKNINILKAARVVGRVMNASDAFWVTSGKESLATMIAYEEADINRFKYAFSPKERARVKQFINEKLSLSKDQVDKIRTELDQEAIEQGYTDQQKQRVFFEMIDNERDPSMVKESTEEAARSSGNVNTYGTVGYFADAFASRMRGIGIPTTRKPDGTWNRLPIGGKIAAFTRISSNVAERALDYTPVGFLRANLRDKNGGQYGYFLNIDNPSQKRYIRELSPRERVNMLKRAVQGTAAHLTLLAVAAATYDKKDTWMRITANGTGDYTKNKELEGTGVWKPYTVYFGNIGVSYRGTPLILTLAPIGYASDQMRFNNDKGDLKFWDEYMKGIMSTPATIMDMTALSQLNRLVSIASRGATMQTVAQFFGNIVKGYYTPGLLRDGEKIFDILAGKKMKENDNFMDRLIYSNPIWSTAEKAVGKSMRQDAIDVLGEPVDIRTPWWEFADINNVTNKLLDYHLKYAAPIPVPRASGVNFSVMLRNGSMTTRSFTMLSQRDKKLWHLYLKTRGQIIKEGIQSLMDAGVDGDAYKKEINRVIRDANKQAKSAVEVEIMNKPYDK